MRIKGCVIFGQSNAPSLDKGFILALRPKRGWKEAPEINQQKLVGFGVRNGIGLFVILADTIPSVLSSAVSGFGLFHRLTFDRT